MVHIQQPCIYVYIEYLFKWVSTIHKTMSRRPRFDNPNVLPATDLRSFHASRPAAMNGIPTLDFRDGLFGQSGMHPQPAMFDNNVFDVPIPTNPSESLPQDAHNTISTQYMHQQFPSYSPNQPPILSSALQGKNCYHIFTLSYISNCFWCVMGLKQGKSHKHSTQQWLILGMV